MTKNFMIIAMDGGAASGKSTSAHALASRLNLLYVDTGAHFRALTYFFISENIDLLTLLRLGMYNDGQILGEF